MNDVEQVMTAPQFALLRFDGTMGHGAKVLAQFTEVDEFSPSYGATFFMDISEGVRFNASLLSIKRNQKRQQFSK